MKKIDIEDLKVLETYLKHARGEMYDPDGTVKEAIAYIDDALAEIKRWQEQEL